MAIGICYGLESFSPELFMAESLKNFWQHNGDGIIVSLITGFIFFVLGPLGLWFSGRKVRRERMRAAKDSLLNLIEEMMVSGESLEPAKVTTLFRAVERENEIELEGHYDADNLLDALTLRFSKSKHLDASQKNKYTEQIDALRAKIIRIRETKSERQVPITYAKLLGQLRTQLDAGDKAKSLETVDQLEERLEHQPSTDSLLDILRVYPRLYKRNPRMFFVAGMVAIVFYVYLIRLFFFIHK